MWAASCLASCCAGCACNLCQTAVSSISRRSARIAYCFLFAFSLIASWILRDVAPPLLEKIPCKPPLIAHVLLHNNVMCFKGRNNLIFPLDHVWCGCETDLILVVDAGINHFHQIPDREWFETEAVLRVSLGNFLFFTILSVVMIGVKSQKDPRDSIHHGGWMMKVTCWLLLVIFSMFFVPNEIISFYGKHCFYQGICFRGAYVFPYFLKMSRGM